MASDAARITRPRRRVLLAVVAGLVFLAGALLLNGIWDAAAVSRINIARSEYDQALAKWKAQKIEEYEITTGTMSLAGGVHILRVSDYGNRIDQLYPKALSASAMTPEDVEYLRRDTVEGLFAQVDEMLANSTVFNTVASYMTGDYYMDYQVSFDPTLGYPLYLSGRPVFKSGTHIYDVDWARRVTHLKIIKQGN